VTYFIMGAIVGVVLSVLCVSFYFDGYRDGKAGK
jgi:hypothetical protein